MVICISFVQFSEVCMVFCVLFVGKCFQTAKLSVTDVIAQLITAAGYVISSIRKRGVGGKSGTMGGRSPGCFFWHLKFESQTHMEKILYNESH